jgi:hypothetical protein
MNNIIKAFVFVFSIALSFVSNSCNEFDTLPLNIPFSIKVITQGNSNPTVADPVSYCLNQSSTYNDYADNIQKLTYVEAAFRTDSVKNITLGNVTVTVEVIGGTILFQKTLTGINPASYKSPNAPFILILTANEIAAVNTYLENYRSNPESTPCVRASIQANVTTPTTGPYYLGGFVDMVLEAETKL